jgi:nucleoside-diphosphate-sugar epimerase
VNLYGPRDNFNEQTGHVIPSLIRKCIQARDLGQEYIEAWGDGSPTREFLYVEDAALAVVLATERYNTSDPVNLGSGLEISIKDLLTTIATLTNYCGQIYWDTTKPNGQPRRKVDTTRATAAFGFDAWTSFKVGLSRTIEWYEQTLLRANSATM